MPTKTQMQAVIDSLRTIEDDANRAGALDMEEPRVYAQAHPCRSPACFAGWFAVANTDHPAIREAINAGNCTYVEGAHLMAQMLGFGDRWVLEMWAHQNEDIWGNQYGDSMFMSEIAFNGLEDSEEPMTTIIEHLEGVRDDLPEEIGGPNNAD